jgi:hypothetical protein
MANSPETLLEVSRLILACTKRKSTKNDGEGPRAAGLSPREILDSVN